MRDVAFEVGYDSTQALAKTMRREIDTTPVGVRAGDMPRWQKLFDRRPAATPTARRNLPLEPRLIDMPELPILTATARGMKQGT